MNLVDDMAYDGSMRASDFQDWILEQLGSYNITDLEERCAEEFTEQYDFIG